MMRCIVVALLLLFAAPAFGQTVCKDGRCYRQPPAAELSDQSLSSGILLQPGERLVSIDGKPVACEPGPIKKLALLPFEVARDLVAYHHAKKEARILARQQYSAGHPLGCAPGCRYSGTGWSYSGKPNHCYYGELPEGRCVARACVRGPDGRFVWSAHYR